MANKTSTFINLLSMAERELSAFLCAVEESYGPHQAALSADDWLAEFESTKRLSQLTPREWRRVTMAAAVRLANRLTAADTAQSTHTFVQ